MIVYKKNGKKFDQSNYDYFFHNIENNLRELGYGDVSVNKKMKDLNKILYDILLKIEKPESNQKFNLNHALIHKYFNDLHDEKSEKYMIFKDYFLNFHNFCFDLPLENVISESENFKN
jgi:cytochrome b pre-mRNA-processing protein 3